MILKSKIAVFEKTMAVFAIFCIGIITTWIFSFLFAISTIISVTGGRILFFIILCLFLGIAFVNKQDIKNVFKNKPLLIIALFILYFFSAWATFPKSGKLGFVNTGEQSNEYSSQHWYFLHRASFSYPFNEVGLAYINNEKTLSIPNGYDNVEPITGEGWYSIVPHLFWVWVVIDSFIFGFYGLVIFVLLQKINTKAKK